MGLVSDTLRQLLDEKVAAYNNMAFIGQDPISIPHRFAGKQDIEIAGLFAASLAWGNRTTILASCGRLMDIMGNSPFDFIKNHTDADLKALPRFVHRTFNSTDLLYFFYFLREHYAHSDTLEDAFVPRAEYDASDTGPAIIQFNKNFFAAEHPERTRKHIATPERNSACKRMNMYLRWMVRCDEKKVDFGIWEKIKPSQLVCPLDVHVARVAHKLGLLPENKANWKNALALTAGLRELNPADPAIYDFALFSLGATEHF